MVRPLIITTAVIPLTHNPAVLRENGIIKAYTSTRIARSGYYISSSTLNKNYINI
jgi:hypothetical protein